MYLALAREYARRGLVMQWHLAVKRSANTALLRECGPNTGGDCIGAPIPAGDIIRILDAANLAGELPRMILYTLDAGMTALLSTIAGSFPGVHLGAAWWFCDHRRGIRELCAVLAETGYIGGFLGMLTDSRSFMSYPRHDYFRRIFASLAASGGKGMISHEKSP
jgi:glucuronate isomerase